MLGEKPGKEIRLKIEKTVNGDRIGARGLNIRNRKRNQERGERSEVFSRTQNRQDTTDFSPVFRSC